MPRKTITKQKQKQTQNVKQTVIVKLDSKGHKIKRRRRRQPSGGGASSMSQYQQLPPVVYQLGDPYTYRANPPPTEAPAPLVAAPAAAPKSAVPAQFQDVGIGTEGFVEILERPLKREQQEDFITPVKLSKQQKDNSSDKNIPNTFQSTFTEPQIHESVGRKPENLSNLFGSTPYNFNSMYQPFVEVKPSTEFNPRAELEAQRLQKLQKQEAASMATEDIRSTILGGSEYNYRKPIVEPIKEPSFIPEKQTESPPLSEAKAEKKPKKPLTEEQKRKRAEYAKSYRQRHKPEK